MHPRAAGKGGLSLELLSPAVNARSLVAWLTRGARQNNMNTRANIMYFIEHFLDMANKDGYDDYVRMMQRDIIRVVDAVAPDDGSGAANVKVVRKVSHCLLTLIALPGYECEVAADTTNHPLRSSTPSRTSLSWTPRP